MKSNEIQTSVDKSSIYHPTYIYPLQLHADTGHNCEWNSKTEPKTQERDEKMQNRQNKPNI